MATFGLKVENPHIGIGFWDKVINILTKGKVQPKDVKKVGDKICSTRWNDPIDTFTKFKEVSWVNVHEVRR